MNERTWHFKSNRTESPDGFRFLPVPPWWYILHPFDATTSHAKVARIAYMIDRFPERFKADSVKHFTWLMAHYPIYWFFQRLKMAGKRLLALSIVFLILGVPFLVGLMAGGHIIINVSAGR